MLGAAAAALYTMVSWDPWRRKKVERNRLGEQWNLGQILSIFTLAPVIIELVMSFDVSKFIKIPSGPKNPRDESVYHDLKEEEGVNILYVARNYKRRIVTRRLIARHGEQLNGHEMSGNITDSSYRVLLTGTVARSEGDGRRYHRIFRTALRRNWGGGMRHLQPFVEKHFGKKHWKEA